MYIKWMKKSFIHNEDECLHSSPMFAFRFTNTNSFCDKILGFYLHVYKQKNILPSQVPT